MKELSIEEKAKRYDIALDKIKRLLGTGSSCSREELEYVFPELAESREDEKIRKALIKLVKKVGEGYENVIDGVSIENAISWLESLRFQFTWKPSDAQMKLLREVQQALLGKDCHNRFVNFMYELKRLREE